MIDLLQALVQSVRDLLDKGAQRPRLIWAGTIMIGIVVATVIVLGVLIFLTR
jgi:hypothetical protein